MSNLVPIEFKNQRIMTTKVLAEEYGTKEENIQMNFSRNEKRFVQGKHYYKLEGHDLKIFKNSLPTESREPIKFAPVLYLWTEKGAARHAKILDTDEAWEVYEELEETYFRVKEVTQNISQLSPELQAFKQIFDSMAKQELEHKRLQNEIAVAKQETAAVKQEVEDIREVIIINPKEEWRKETNKLIGKICYKLQDYKAPKDEVYRALEERAKCKLSVRLKNLQGRALREGMALSKVNQLNNLDVITNEPRLKEIYVAIVKELAVKNGVA